MLTPSQVQSALQNDLPGAVYHLKLRNGGRIGGVILWDGFRDQAIDTRQKSVWNLLKKGLRAQATNIGLLILMTQDEYDAV